MLLTGTLTHTGESDIQQFGKPSHRSKPEFSRMSGQLQIVSG